MNSLIKAGIVTALIASAVHAQAAIYCTGDAECLSKGLSMIKKASKAGCDASGLAEALKSPVSSHQDFNATVIQGIEVCIEQKKYVASQTKKAGKRIERIQKALATPEK